MKRENEIFLCRVGHRNKNELGNEDVCRLIDSLSGLGIKIDKGNSELFFTYSIMGKVRDSTLPIDGRDRGLQIFGYKLNGSREGIDNFELIMKSYHWSHSYMKNFLTPSEDLIHCSIKVEGKDGHVLTQEIERIEDHLVEYYGMRITSSYTVEDIISGEVARRPFLVQERPSV